MTTSRPRTIVAVLASVLALGGAATASAHTDVRSTTPTSGGTAKTTLARVTVTFTGNVRSGTLRVVGPGGKVVSASGGVVDPRKPTPAARRPQALAEAGLVHGEMDGRRLRWAQAEGLLRLQGEEVTRARARADRA